MLKKWSMFLGAEVNHNKKYCLANPWPAIAFGLKFLSCNPLSGFIINIQSNRGV